ncbi:AarF/ABC1/UbiB kinase family protein [Streptomyces sp. NPDC005921]
MAPRTGSRMRTVAAVLKQVLGETRAAPPSDAPDERERRRARAVRGALESLGPFYVKIGQMLSTRPDMVSPIMIEELQNLHDEVAVQPFSELEPVLEQNLGPDWKRYFDDIDVERPLGAASLAQVHRVTLADGRPGVIKVQRPGIRETVLADMALLRRAARLTARVAPRFSAVVDVESMLGGVFDAMEPELDFTKEAANMDRAREALRGFSRLSVPNVLAATEGVLVQSMAPGVSVRKADPAALRDRDRLAVSRELIAFMYRSYFIERIYHADPHAGNVFVTEDGEATLIDWGMIGRIDQRTSMRLLLVLMAVAQNDGHGLAKAWVEMGRTTPWSDIPGFSQDMAALVPKIATASLAELNFGITLTSVLEKSTRRSIASCPAVLSSARARCAVWHPSWRWWTSSSARSPGSSCTWCARPRPRSSRPGGSWRPPSPRPAPPNNSARSTTTSPTAACGCSSARSRRPVPRAAEPARTWRSPSVPSRSIWTTGGAGRDRPPPSPLSISFHSSPFHSIRFV